LGRRIGSALPPPADLRVLAVGDSFVAGLAVEYGDLLTTRLAALLSAELGRRVGVVADAAPGWGPEQYARVVEDELAGERFDAVLVFLFMGNDVVERRGAGLSAEEFTRGLARRLRWPRRAGWEEIQAAWLRPLDDHLEETSQLYVLVKSRLESLRLRLGLSPVAIPWPLLRARAAGPEWGATAELGAEIAGRAAARGAPLLFVLLPANYQVDQSLFERHAAWLGVDPARVDLEQPSRLLAAAFAGRGLAVADATPALRAAWRAGEAPLFGRVDTHLTPAGHRVVAEWLAPLVRGRLLTR
jgi:lysophospholipase L1-like esterase